MLPYFLLVLSQAEFILSGCSTGYFKNGGNCERCGLYCKSCNGHCYSCLHESCPNDTCFRANCADCNSSNTTCTSCPDGYFLEEGFCRRCIRPNCQCSLGNECTDCLSGKYDLQNFCYRNCSSNCISCNDSMVCTECATGKFTRNCEKDCTSTCQDGSCDIDSGTCLKGCRANQYTVNAGCKDCPLRCSTCVDFQNCTSCIRNYKWGPACEWDCLSCVEGMCSKDHGCLECSGNYFRVNTSDGQNCQRCLENCASCENLANCNSCEEGFWGNVCENNCTGCIGNLCDRLTGACSTGCLQGFVERSSDSRGIICAKCPDFCEICYSQFDCKNCTHGYFLQGTNKCIKCSSTCGDKMCDNDSCTEGCQESWLGPYCNETCPSACSDCAWNITVSCVTCKYGFFGANCEKNCNGRCYQGNDENQICGKENGHCIYGCKSGYWGTTCDLSCSNGCENNTCNKSTGVCLFDCKRSYFGENCDYSCSSNCRTDNQTSRQCEIISGSCNWGCVQGYYGINCSKPCSKSCKNSVCFQHNGTCEQGCAEGIAGDDCMVKNKGSKENDDGISAGALVGAAVAVIITIVFVAVVLMFIMKKRSFLSFFNWLLHVRGCGQRNPEGRVSFTEKSYKMLEDDDNAYATIIDTKSAETNILNARSSNLINIAEEKIRKYSKNVETKFSIKSKDTKSRNQGAEKSEETYDKKAVMKYNSSSGTQQNLNVELDVRLERNTAILGLDTSAIEDKQRHTGHFRGSDTTNLTEHEEAVLNLKDTETYTRKQNNANQISDFDSICKRVAVSELPDYIRNKSSKEMTDEFQKLPNGLLKSHTAAKYPANTSKNRYKNIYPYDESRVRLLNDCGNDYLNASYIQGYNRPKEYIAAAGPFKRKDVSETVNDFWQMVWQERCETILMLTKCYEDGQYQCDQYWPEEGDNTLYGKLNVTCMTENQYADFTIRTFCINKDSVSLKTQHIQYTAWPDKGVPSDVTSMIEYREIVRSLHQAKTSPIVVHCSAGIGRTGVFIALDLLTFTGEALGYVDIFRCVTDLRAQRTCMVQTQDQYIYIHHAILHLLTFDCKRIHAEEFITHYSRIMKKKDGLSQIETQFKGLQSIFDEFAVEEKEVVTRNKTLKDKNRDGADIPEEEYRVRLLVNREPESSDYINAVFLNGARACNRFIVAQTPLPLTAVDFLTMVQQTNCHCIVMMDDPDLKDQTVGVLWPSENQVMKHGVFQVQCQETQIFQDYTKKKFTILGPRQDVQVKQDINLFVFTDWPKDAAVPASSESLYRLIKEVDKVNHQDQKQKTIIVCCKTGARRSCLFCAVCILIEKMEVEHEISVVNTIRQIKARRRSAIPTLEQYKFCHQALISYIQKFDTHSNFGFKSETSIEGDAVYAKVQKKKSNLINIESRKE